MMMKLALRGSARLATLLAVPTAVLAPPLAPPAAADEPEMIQQCWTMGLSDEEVAEGAVSELHCEEVPADQPFELPSFRGSFAVATHYLGWYGSGSNVTVVRDTCDTSARWSSSHPWGDQTASTVVWSPCGSAKHFANFDYTGATQTVTGGGLLPDPENILPPLLYDVSAVTFS